MDKIYKNTTYAPALYYTQMYKKITLQKTCNNIQASLEIHLWSAYFSEKMEEWKRKEACCFPIA